MNMAGKSLRAVVLVMALAMLATFITSPLITSPASAGPPPDTPGDSHQPPPSGSDPATLAACTEIFNAPAGPSAPLTQKHCDALEAIYHSTGGPNWSTQWLTTGRGAIDPCQFSGVWCDPATGVVRLELSGYNLVGPLPIELGDLESLNWLSLYSNSITSVPASIGNLDQLERLMLGGNNVQTLPDTFGALTNLTMLSVYDNDLKTLPPSIGSLVSLRILNAAGNELTVVPEALANLSDLRELHIASNMLTSMPDVSGYPLLTDLTVNNNNLVGAIDGPIKELSQGTPVLERVNLGDNQLVGEVPTSLLSMSQLALLQLEGNGCLSAGEAVTNFMATLWTFNGPNTGADVLEDCGPNYDIFAEPVGPIGPWEDPTDPIGPIVRDPAIQRPVMIVRGR